MRNALICLVVLLGAFVAYAYVQDPAGCQKVLNDAYAVVSAVSPIPLHSDAAVPISTLTEGKLISADGNPFSFPANAPVTSIRYYAIYYSAQWSTPCQTFTPTLIQWYKKFKPLHPNFELIFVSEDHSEIEMLDYMKEMAMPWPAVRFSDLHHPVLGTYKSSGIGKFAGSDLPDLVLVDAGGKVLSDSYQGSVYTGPESVLADINKLVGAEAAAPSPSSATSAAVPAAPPQAPATAVAPPVSASAANPSPEAVGPWAPPDVMPSQPNWTWETSDGKTYQNVVVTKIDSDTVTISHSQGVAHIPINLLPPDIQKKLHYDPAASAAAHAENERESAHPYFDFASRADAQELARQLHRPLAWMITTPTSFSVANPGVNSTEDLAQMALNYLKSRAVVVFTIGDADISILPPLVRGQLFKSDDGSALSHFDAPKIVISNPDGTKIFGRVSDKQMAASRELAIDQVLISIPKNSDAQSLPPTAAPIPATSPLAPTNSTAPLAPASVANPSAGAIKP